MTCVIVYVGRMDALSDLMRDVRADGALFASSTLTAPWSLHFVDGAPLTLCTVLGGAGWIVAEGGPPLRVNAYDVVLVRGPRSFSFVDEVDTPAVPIACGAQSASPEQGGTRHRLGWHDPGQSARDAGESEGAGSIGSDIDGPGAATATLVVGAYFARSEINRRLLDALPVALRVQAGNTTDPVLDHLAAEAAVDAPGQQVVLDRLLDWMLVCTLREHFEGLGERAPSWWTAQRDPVAGAALQLLHAQPASSWTVAALAEGVGVSRATLAKRFTDQVGEPPLGYLTRWRMTLAVDLLLARPTLTVASIADRVGYSDPFAFSAAFKRLRGSSPRDFRRDHPAGQVDPDPSAAHARATGSFPGPR
jgi:AraC-like DNA-binding protein